MQSLLIITVCVLTSFMVIIMIVADVVTRKYIRSLFKSVERLEAEMNIETTPIPPIREREDYQLNRIPERLDRIRDFYRYPNYRDKVQSNKEPIPLRDKE